MQAIRWLGLIGACLGGALVAMLLLAVGTTAWILYTTVPDYAGTDRLPGLVAPVTVIRGPHAIPHIFANNLDDGYRALGYLHAQDRFFQMDYARRLAAGRMAEFAGAGIGALQSDRFMRTLGLYRAADAAVNHLRPSTRTALAAYTEGVNAWLASKRFVRPPELVLGAITPEPWRPADSIAIGRLMALLLSDNWRDELLRAELSQRLSHEQIDDLWPDDPPNSPVTLRDLAEIVRDLDPGAIAAAVPDIFPAASASNSWVVDGAHSESGKPLLANDPHLGFSAPGWWYLARIVTPGGVRAGAMLAGQPYVLIGHNGRVAWGLTTTHADTQDLFVERIDPADPSRYLTSDGPTPFEARQETISVRFGDPVSITVRETRHGPVISDIVPRANAAVHAGHVVALSWPALRADDRTTDAVAGMNAASNADAFVEALRTFDSPMQNITFADINGYTGFYAAARVPVRKSGDGRAPVPGWSGEYDWTGFVPFDELPRAIAPATGRIVNANNKIVGPDYPWLIAADWPEAYRAERIHELLDRTEKHSVDGFARLQMDSRSDAARDLLRLMTGLAGGLTTDPEANEMLARLTRWDGTMARGAVEPLVYMAWARELSRRLYRDETGEAFDRFLGFRPNTVRHMLVERQTWCDDIGTPRREKCAEIAARAFDTALAMLRKRLGEDISAWRWGTVHKAEFRHPILRRIPVLGRLFGIAIETDGGPDTINRGTARLSGDPGLFAHVHGPGLRAVFDLANLDAARFMIASGQSGHPLSPYYTDTTESWRDGKTLLLSGSFAALRRKAVAVMTLEP